MTTATLEQIEYTSSIDCSDSSIFRNIVRNANDDSVTVEFRRDGEVWRYAKVNEDAWKEWSDADSYGSYYTAWIRGYFASENIGNISDFRYSWVAPAAEDAEQQQEAAVEVQITATFSVVPTEAWERFQHISQVIGSDVEVKFVVSEG